MSDRRLPREARDFIARMAAEGWTFDRVTTGGHLAFTHPVGGRTFASVSPSDHRTRRNELAHARRRVNEREQTPRRPPQPPTLDRLETNVLDVLRDRQRTFNELQRALDRRAPAKRVRHALAELKRAGLVDCVSDERNPLCSVWGIRP